jgi:hypothetical protein
MRALAAGLLSAIAAFGANRLFFRTFSNAAMIGPVPLAEEVAKTMIAFWLGTAIVYTHLAFGLAEGVLDWRGQSKSLPAAAAAVAAHGVFGLVTEKVSGETGILGLGILSAFIIHSFWNMAMLYRTAKR